MLEVQVEEVHMLASKWYSLWIRFRSFWTVFRYSCAAIFVGTFYKNPRPILDGMIRRFSSTILKLASVNYKVFGQNNFTFDANKQYIIMSNHESHYDIPLIFVALPGSIRMLTKKELFKIPVFGRAMSKADFVSIDRKNSDQAMRDLETAKQKMMSGIILWVAPEGTRSRTGKIGPFKKGGFMVALQTGATIIPVGIRGSFEILPADTWDLCLDQLAEVHIGKPIDASQFDVNQRDALMQVVDKAIRELADQGEVES